MQMVMMVQGKPYIPSPKDVHVKPASGFWDVKVVRDAFAIGTYITQLEAIGVGITQAREGLAFLVVHNRNGQIRSVHNYSVRKNYPD